MNTESVLHWLGDTPEPSDLLAAIDDRCALLGISEATQRELEERVQEAVLALTMIRMALEGEVQCSGDRWQLVGA